MADRRSVASTARYTTTRREPKCCGTTALCKVRTSQLIRMIATFFGMIVLVDRSYHYIHYGDVTLSPAATLVSGWILAIGLFVAAVMAYIGFEQTNVL